jgi:hypothetical protein
MAVGLVFVVAASGLLGFGLRYVLPKRDRLGIALMPSVGVITGSLGWATSMWVGLSPDGLWSWIISLGLAALAPIVVGLMLPPRRDASDAALWIGLAR